MFSATRVCITCNSTFTIHHPAQKRKKYCSDRCSKSWTQKVKKEKNHESNEPR